MSKMIQALRLCALALVAGATLNIATPETAHAGISTGCLPGVLKARLSQIRKKFGPVRIVSAHRPGARIAGSGKPSYHGSCRAVDFHPPKGKYSKVVAWLRANHGGGVGTYSCGMHHIHIDNGPRVRFHHCVNASGTPIKRYAVKGGSKRYAKKSYSKKKYKGKRYASKGKSRPKIGYKSKKKSYKSKSYAKKSKGKKYKGKSRPKISYKAKPKKYKSKSYAKKTYKSKSKPKSKSKS